MARNIAMTYSWGACTRPPLNRHKEDWARPVAAPAVFPYPSNHNHIINKLFLHKKR